MTDERPTPDKSAGKKGRASAAPTIDLTATEVPPPAGDEPVRESAPSPPEPAKQEPPAQEPPNQEPPASMNAERDVAPDTSPGDAPSTSGARLTGPVLAAGVAGAVAMTVVLFGLWFAGWVPIRYAGSTALRARVTGLEMQLKDIQKRPAQTAGGNGADTQQVDALNARVATLEDAIKSLPGSSGQADPALMRRVSEADNAMKSLGVALTALNHRNDDLAAEVKKAQDRAAAAEKSVTDLRGNLQDVSKTANAGASSADIESLQKRIAVLEQQAKTANAEIAKASSSDTSARRALSAATLRDAVARGATFEDELAQAKSLGAGDKVLGPLMPFAATGLPNDKALAQELSALLPGMIKAAAPVASGSFLDRLKTNAGQLVHIRPLDAPQGSDPTDVLARVQSDAAHADIAAAVSDLEKLPEAQRAPARGWIAKAKNRQAALAAARQFAADTARSLGSR